MSDTPATLTPTETIAVDAAPVLSNALKLADDGLALIAQPIKSAQLDKPINEAKDRTAQYEDILSETDPAVLTARLGAFVAGMFNDANIPIGQFSGATRATPVESFTGFIYGLIQLIEAREQKSATAAAAK